MATETKWEMSCEDCGKTWQAKTVGRRCLQCHGGDVKYAPVQEPTRTARVESATSQGPGQEGGTSSL